MNYMAAEFVPFAESRLPLPVFSDEDRRKCASARSAPWGVTEEQLRVWHDSFKGLCRRIAGLFSGLFERFRSLFCRSGAVQAVVSSAEGAPVAATSGESVERASSSEPAAVSAAPAVVNAVGGAIADINSVLEGLRRPMDSAKLSSAEALRFCLDQQLSHAFYSLSQWQGRLAVAKAELADMVSLVGVSVEAAIQIISSNDTISIGALGNIELLKQKVQVIDVMQTTCRAMQEAITERARFALGSEAMSEDEIAGLAKQYGLGFVAPEPVELQQKNVAAEAHAGADVVVTRSFQCQWAPDEGVFSSLSAGDGSRLALVSHPLPEEPVSDPDWAGGEQEFVFH